MCCRSSSKHLELYEQGGKDPKICRQNNTLIEDQKKIINIYPIKVELAQHCSSENRKTIEVDQYMKNVLLYNIEYEGIIRDN